MDQKTIDKQVAAWGVARTALLIDNSHGGGFNLAEERFYLKHWRELGGHELVHWLCRCPPEGAEERPHVELVPRITHWMAARAAEHSFFQHGHLSNHVRSLWSALFRDDVVEHLRPLVPAETWARLLQYASGCAIYASVVEFESRQRKEPEYWPPHHLIPEGASEWVAVRLFPDRRDKGACAKRLRGMILDHATAAYTLWLLREAGLLDRVVTPELLLGGLPTLSEAEPADRPMLQFRLEIAGDLAEVPAFRDAITLRVADAIARGVPWGYLWWEVPPKLRDHVAVASIDMARPAPWSVSAIRRLPRRQLWGKLLALLDRAVPDTSVEALREEFRHFRAGEDLQHMYGGTRMEKSTANRAFDEFWPATDEGWPMAEPLPEGADRAFEELLGAGLRKHGVLEKVVLDRLSELPLTEERAQRLAACALKSDCFYQLRKAEQIAAACGRSTLPIPRPWEICETSLRAYKLLVDDDHAVVDWFDEALATKDFDQCLSIARHDDSLRTGERAAGLRELIPRGNFGALVRLQAAYPWLLAERDVIEEGARPGFDDEQLLWLTPRPGYLTPFLETKVATTKDPAIANGLLAHLKQNGVAPSRLAQLAIERLERCGSHGVDPYQVGGMLTSKKLWERFGQRLILAVISEPRGAWWLADVSSSAARDQKSSVLAVLHAVLADALIELVRRALVRRDEASAQRYLEALAQLTAPPRLLRSVQALRALPSSPSLLLLIEAIEGLVKKSDGEFAGIDALLEAFAACSTSARPDGGGEARADARR